MAADGRGITKPRQNIPESQKNENWYLDNLYYYLGLYNSPANVEQRSIIERNWRVYMGDIDAGDINYLIYPEGNADPTLTVQAIFKNYQLAYPLIQQRIGEFLRQKLSFSVDIVNREAVLEKQERMAAIMSEKIAKKVLAQIEKETGIAIPVEERSLGLPDDLKKLQNMSIREGVEDLVLNSLHYLNDRYELKEVFRKGLESMLISNSVLFRNERINNDPVTKWIHPLDTAVFMQTDDDNVRWGDAWITPQWLSISDILDGYQLTSDQIDLLESLQKNSWEQLSDTFWKYGNTYNGFQYNYFYRNIGQDTAKVLVTKVQWRSITHIYVKKSKNMYSDSSYFYKKITEEEYNKLSKSAKADLIRVPYYDLREATMVGHKMLIQYGRVKDQTRKEQYGIGRVPLDLCGIKKDPMQAVMTILAPLQVEYSIGWFHIERLLAQSGGRVIELWLHNKPDGWSNEKWIFYAKHKGIIPRQYKEGDEPAPNPQMSQAIDLGLGSGFQYLIQYVTLIEQTAQKLIGTNPAAQGFLKGDELVGNINANVIQASTIAESIYFDTRRAIEQVLNDATDKLKQWWQEGDVKVWLNDKEMIPMKVTSDLSNYEYGVFVKNDATDEVRMRKFEAMAQQALASGGADMLDFMMELVDAEDSAEAKEIVVRGMQEMRKRKEAMEQQQLQIQQAGVQAQEQANQLKQAELQVKRETPVDVAKTTGEYMLKREEMKINHDENKSEVEGNKEDERLVFQELAKQKQKA